MKRGKKLIVMCLALVVLVAGYMVVREVTAEPEEGAGEVIVSLDSSSLSSLYWTYAAQESDEETSDEEVDEAETVELTYEDSQWEYAQDSAFPLSQQSVDTLIAQITEITAGTKISSPAELTEYGLDEPVVEIEIGTGDTQIQLSIGDENAITGECYLVLDGDESVVYTVSSELRDAFSLGIYDIIEMEEIPDFGDVTELSLTQPEGDLKLIYVEDSGQYYYNDTYHWFVERDGEYLAVSSNNAQSLYGNVTGLNWLSCVAYDASDEGTLSAYGLAEPETVVELTHQVTEEVDTGQVDEDGNAIMEEETHQETFRLLIGGDCDEGAYAMLDGSTMVYVISMDTADSLRYATYNSLKSSLVCDMEWDTVDSVEISIGDQAWTVDFSTREEETVDENGDADTTTVNVYTWGETELAEDDFDNILDSLNSLSVTASATGEPGEEMLTVVFRRSTEYFAELTLTARSYSADECWISFNGVTGMLVERSSVTSLIDSVQDLFEGTE